MLKKLSIRLLLLAASFIPALGQSPTLVSIAANPASLSAFTNTATAVQVIGTYSDGSTQDVTSNAIWASSDPAAVQVNNSSLMPFTVTAINGVETVQLTANVGSVSTTLPLVVLPGVNEADYSATAGGSVALRGGNQGVVPFSTFAGNTVDSLNLATDNVLLSIPVRSKNEQIPFSFALVGNSSATIVGPASTHYWNVSTGINGVVGGVVGGILGDNIYYTPGSTNCQGHHDQTYTNFGIADSMGGHHFVSSVVVDSGVFLNGTTFHCDKTNVSGGANDNSGLAMQWGFTVPTKIWDNHGNIRTNPSYNTATVTDKNGNTMSVTWTSATAYKIVDSEGATVLTASVPPISNGSTQTYSYTDFNGVQQNFIVTYAAYTEYTQFGCGGLEVRGASGGYILPSYITIPKMVNDSAAGRYIFTYEVTDGGYGTTGRLGGVYYPTGGYTQYIYQVSGSAPINCSDDLTIPTLVRTTTDTTSGVVSQWTYSTAGVNLNTLNENVTAALWNGGTDVYNFSNAFATEKNVGGILDTYVCYNGASGKSACVTPSSQLSATVTQTAVYSSAANGASGTYSEVDTTYSLNLPLVTTKYDFNGTAESQTTNAWETVNGAVLPQSVTTVDPTQNNKQIALTKFGYDSKGDLNSKQQWVSGSNYLTTTYTPNANNGTLTSVKDPNGTITTLHYTSGVCSKLVPTSQTNNFNTLNSSVTLDSGCIGGVPTAQTPVSGYPSSETYGDPFWRATTATDEAGNVATTDYRLNSVTTSTPNPGGGTLSKVTTLDSLGRPIFQQTYQGSGSDYDTVQTEYDELNRVWFVSTPYTAALGGGQGNNGGMTTVFDAASRPKTVTDANGGVITYTYSSGTSGYAVKSSLTPIPAGDHGTQKSRILQYDGLGRLTSVCEVNSLSGAAACGQTIAGTGYYASYTYDALNRLVGVTQGSQLRTFTFDGVGRMIQESNPETRTTAYHYDGDKTNCAGFTNLPGDLASVVHQSGTYICYNFDGLHRQTTAVGSDGTNKSFVWDSSTVHNQAVGQNGKIAEGYTCNDSVCKTGVVTDEGFAYDTRGNVTTYLQSSPQSGGWYQANLQRDSIGNLSSFSVADDIYGAVTPTFAIMGYDAEGRPVQIKAGQNYAILNAVYGFFGPTYVEFNDGDTDTFSYDQIGHMTNYKYNMGSYVYSGSPSWNMNGTVSSLVTTDNIPLNGGGAGTVNYTYDDLGRIWTAVGGNLNQTYTYDRYGNLSTSGSPYSWIPTYNSAANQYQAVGNCSNSGGIGYDADGNLLCDSFNSYAYDAFEEMTNYDAGSSNVVYDAFGKEVENGVPDQYLQIPGFSGSMYFNGQLLNTSYIPIPGGYAIPGPNYVDGYAHVDWHGNSRLTTTSSSTLWAQNEYSPFGQMYDLSDHNCCYVGIFDGAVFDSLIAHAYDMPNRRLHSIQGRWLQPDPAGVGAANPVNPQSWNRYAYAGNDPVVMRDPTGLADCTMDGADAPCGMVLAALGGGGAAGCPNNNCAPQYNNGQWQFFRAWADGSSGYMPGSLAGFSSLDVANALAMVEAAVPKVGTPSDPASLTGRGADAYRLLTDPNGLNIAPGDITIYQNDGGDFGAVLSAQGFSTLMSGLDSNPGDAFLHYPYTDGARDYLDRESLHAVWFDPNLTNYVGGSGVYMQFHTDADNPWQGSMWNHMMCVLFKAGCQ